MNWSSGALWLVLAVAAVCVITAFFVVATRQHGDPARAVIEQEAAKIKP